MKWKATDPDGRRIVTRYGDSAVGWNHFSHRHNIKKCSIINAAVSDKVDRHNKKTKEMEYWGHALHEGKNVQFVVKVQYSRSTRDEQRSAPYGETIGVVTAYCKNQPKNRCPNWMNG